jgi:hypothetical protein
MCQQQQQMIIKNIYCFISKQLGELLSVGVISRLDMSSVLHTRKQFLVQVLFIYFLAGAKKASN